MTNPKAPINPIRDFNGEKIYTGITKREWFAAHQSLDIKDLHHADATEITGVPIPDKPLDDIEWLLFWMKVEARLKVMQADALIEALNESVK